MRKVRSGKDRVREACSTTPCAACSPTSPTTSSATWASTPCATGPAAPAGDARRRLPRPARGHEGLLPAPARQPQEIHRGSARSPDARRHVQSASRRARPQAAAPTAFSTLRTKEIERFEEAFNSQFNGADHRHHREAHPHPEVLRDRRGAGPAHLRSGQPGRRTVAAGRDGASGNPGAQIPAQLKRRLRRQASTEPPATPSRFRVP